MKPAPETLRTPNSPGEEGHYSYNWGKAVVDKLVGSYPRATNCVLESLGLSTRNLIYYCCNRQKEWIGLKKLIKYLDKASPAGYGGPESGQSTAQLLSNWLNAIDWNLPNSMIRHLTGRLGLLKLKEQVSSKGLVADCTRLATNLPSDLPGQLLLWKGTYDCIDDR